MTHHHHKHQHPSGLQWLSLVGIIWLQSINGPNTDFPAYSSQLKNLLSLSQLQLNNLAFASDAGKLLGWLSAIATLHLPLWLVLVTGGTLGFIGYGVQFLFLANKISSPAYWQIFMLTVLAGNSTCWINTVSYMVTIRNFPFDRQIAVGLSTSYVGLSAKIYTDVVNFVSSSARLKQAETYLLVNSILPLVVSMVTAPLLRDIDIRKVGNGGLLGKGFIIMFVITTATGVYAVVDSLGALNGLRPSVHAVGIAIMLAIPLVIPVSSWIKEVLEQRWKKQRQRRVHGFSSDEICDKDRVEIEVKGGEEDEQDIEEQEMISTTRVREEIGVKLMIKTMEFWLYFFVYMFGAALGLVFLNNLGQIAESRGNVKASSLVSLSSSFGFFGRLAPSLLDYYLSRKEYGVSRIASIVILMGPMAGAFFLLLNPTDISLYISTAIIGICTGAITSIAVTTTTELFGVKNFSLNHNILVVNIPIGSFLFGYLAAFLYQREGSDADTVKGRCMGFECYRKTFIIWGCISSLGTLLALILYFRTRKFYLRKN